MDNHITYYHKDNHTILGMDVPFITFNNYLGGGEGTSPKKVSDLYKDLMIPSWFFLSPEYKEEKKKTYVSENEEFIDDDLMNKLIVLNNSIKKKIKKTLNKKKYGIHKTLKKNDF
jgi:hypothetical protein